MYRLQL